MKKQDIRSFLIKNYVVLFVTTILFTLVLGTAALVQQARDAKRLFESRIQSVVVLQKDQFLNELALNDTSALQQHIEIVHHELSIDQISLELKSETLRYPTKFSGLKGPFAQAFTYVFGVKPVIVHITNDFSTIKAAIVVRYEVSFLNSVVKPFAISALIILFISLVAISALFLGLFKKLNRGLIEPLGEVTRRLEAGVENTELFFSNGTSLREIQALELATVQFKKMERMALYSQVAKQVAHDIRSPLSALKVIADRLANESEETRILLKGAIDRISAIAGNLIEKSQPIKTTPRHQRTFLFAVIDSIVTEKQIQHPQRPTITFITKPEQAFGIFTVCDSTELKRALSNLIQNAIEACNDDGQVTISLEHTDMNAAILIEDNGIGIPNEILARLGEPGFTFGKSGAAISKSGSGLGIYHAKRTLAQCGGTIKIESQLGKGTKVNLILPTVTAPSWFTTAISLQGIANVCVIDDDPSVHSLWSGRLEALRKVIPGLTEHHFRSPENLEAWLQQNPGGIDHCRFLCDLEFKNSQMDGLSLIKKWALSDHSVIVTNLWENMSLQGEGVKILPKIMVATVPIVM